MKVPWRRRQKGIETDNGRGGYCAACDRTMRTGPDACLGWLPNVAHACCGHGVVVPYVVIGGEPNQDARTIDNPVRLEGRAAIDFFRDCGKGPPAHVPIKTRSDEPAFSRAVGAALDHATDIGDVVQVIRDLLVGPGEAALDDDGYYVAHDQRGKP